ncbi:FG-GAP repeat protein [Planctomycetes bacterium Pan216]|uniref:FG-GAP repeat protein n=1 Tax=Kolteria novifilia TaxID=2527975 RepID=A0A518BAM6_9BACT|nr:FG-GAP repeat protein [Planctomycetes bacterium Pan216]
MDEVAELAFDHELTTYRDGKLSMRITVGVLTLLLTQSLASKADEYVIRPFKKHQLSTDFYAEGVAVGDINKDGKPDVVAGPFWYAGPEFEERREYRPAKVYNKKGYSDNFLTYADDINGDGWDDILVVGFPGKEVHWYQNPQSSEGHWKQHLIHPEVDNEGPLYADLTGDGRNELIFHTKGVFGWAGPDPKDPTKPWTFHPVSENRRYTRFTHGLGVGDVNGDGRADILEKAGWHEQPPATSDVKEWAFHPVKFGDNPSQILVYDVDGDGDNDVIAAKNGHGYGFAWFEHVPKGGAVTFVPHRIMGEKPSENDYGVVYSQLHNLDLVDMDGDGIKDVVSGKRHWAHNGKDPGGNDPAVLYWFKIDRAPDGVSFIPHKVDPHSGGGTEILATDVSGDGNPDIVICNKLGTFVFVQEPKKVDRATWEKQQPKKVGEKPKGTTKAVRRRPPEQVGRQPEEAAKAMTLPEGFSVKVLASEPDVRQPVAQAIDDKGRLWIAEFYSYPHRRPDNEAKDRILVFEDTDGDGAFDKRSVFYEGLNLLSGLEVGHGGVWVSAAPNLLFIPDRDGDAVADGKAEILLDGWGYHDTHELLNSFIWGPDGWLYGCHGVFTHSLVGKPGTPKEERTPLNAAIWRYHPVRHEFEIFAHGTSNPWGFDFNDQGQSFLTCCVIPHLFHVVQGARYHRQAGSHFNPYTYDDIETIAKHRHWTGAHIRDPKSKIAGGGHAHAGAMIYLGGAWPDKYHNQILMNNIHGARLNQDQLEPKGSGYVGDRAPDFLMANDIWSQIINLQYGPDGQMVMIDWYDRTQCHQQRHNTDRSNGRIFKVIYGDENPVKVDLTKLSDAELAELQLDSNDWYVRHARRLLQERTAAGTLDPKVRSRLVLIAFDHPEESRRLRGLWALFLTGGLSDDEILRALEDESPYVRGWAIQLSHDDRKVSPALLERFVALAKDDPSPVVRLYLASALQRLPLADRWAIARALVAHAEDADDHNLPLMYWYAIEPLAPVDPARAIELAYSSGIDLLPMYMTRRVTSIGTPEVLTMLVDRLGSSSSAKEQLTLLRGMNEAFRARRQVPMPKSWLDVATKLRAHADPEIRSQAQSLALTFGDPKALASLRATVLDEKAPTKRRVDAIEALVKARDAALPETLHRVLSDPKIRSAAIRSLAAIEHPETPSVLLSAYAGLPLSEKRDVLGALATREAFAHRLLDAIDAGQVPRTDVTADIVRQLRFLKSDAIAKKLTDVWGIVRETAADKAKLIADTKTMIVKRRPKNLDPMHGRAVFAKNCAQCHRLFSTGGNVGPDLTGSNRANLDYLLGNVLDPSSVMAKDYQPTVFATADGRVITGIIRGEDQESYTVVTANEVVTLPKEDIDEQRRSEKSMMPDDLLKQLTERQVHDLVAYLRGGRQTPMLATPENAGSFFDGKGLVGWHVHGADWKVDDATIVGRSDPSAKFARLVSDMALGDGELSCRARLVPSDAEASLILRGKRRGNDVTGCRCMLGRKRQGHLDGQAAVALRNASHDDKEWIDLRVVLDGARVTTFVDGRKVASLQRDDLPERGLIAFELPTGQEAELHVKDLKLTLPPVAK